MIRIQKGSASVELPQFVGTQGVRLQILLGPNQGVPGFIMRLFEIDPGGYTPLHTHDYEHEIFVLEGSGEVGTPESFLSLEPGDAVLVLPEELHQFRNRCSTIFRFLCIIPI